MRLKSFCTLVIVCLTMASCKQEKTVHATSDLDCISIIFCTPTSFGKSLPLELRNTDKGWEAYYVGAPVKGSLSLLPHYEIDEEGDSIIVFDEIMDNDKQNGKYILHRSPAYINRFEDVTYISATGKDTIEFYTTIIEHGTLFPDLPDAVEAIRSTMAFESEEHTYGNTEQRDLNMSYLIHTRPETLHVPLNIDNLTTFDSPDGKMRIYTFYGFTGGQGLGSSYDIGLLQYETDNGEVATLDNFTDLLFLSIDNSIEYNFPYCKIKRVSTTTVGQQTCYLIEALFGDALYYNSNDASDLTMLFAFTINNGKLTPAPIFDNKWQKHIAGETRQ